ncbi:MAG: HRDC domain-containing protein [Planctomycetes bacterium]|nr:HRDC domain-containing protein [Planctomycetota bacterium]MCC7171094.1 HRDC domain-containing protein [Planctomycetota bacterium]
MNFRLFQYALPAPADLPDLNAFLASHRIASIAQHVITAGSAPMLLFIVQTTGSTMERPSGGDTRIDYKQVLTGPQFAVFERLRKIRKTIADEEAVPAYAVFTNAQLAEFVKRDARTADAMAAVDGIGASRSARYASRLLPAWGDPA